MIGTEGDGRGGQGDRDVPTYKFRLSTKQQGNDHHHLINYVSTKSSSN